MPIEVHRQGDGLGTECLAMGLRGMSQTAVALQALIAHSLVTRQQRPHRHQVAASLFACCMLLLQGQSTMHCQFAFAVGVDSNKGNIAWTLLLDAQAPG